jgi:hypothetical protein
LRKQHRDSFMVVLDLLLDGPGAALPERATVKSPADISRFLNQPPGTPANSAGCCPHLELLVDLTSLEKTGKFTALTDWVHTDNGAYGVPERGAVFVLWTTAIALGLPNLARRRNPDGCPTGLEAPASRASRIAEGKAHTAPARGWWLRER